MKKIKWGILSTAKIGVTQVIPAMQQCKHAEIVGIASRNEEDAKTVAAKLGIPNTYGGYETILQDPEIEAIYIPLPNHLHVEWIHKCLDAGKHVLCEKPLSLHSKDIKGIQEKAEKNKLKAGEAFMVKVHPQWLKVKELIAEGAIGDLKTIHGFFSYFNNDPGNIRNVKDYGGGALWDIGCYPVTQSRFIFGEEPTHVSASADLDPEFKTDRLMSGLLSFPSGTATFTASTQLVPYQRMLFFGTKKMLEIRIPFNAPIDRPCQIVVHQGDKFESGNTVIEIEICNQYTLQGDAFSKAILNDTDVPVKLDDTYNNTRVIEALFASVSESKIVQL
jgi:predicted dehydrogenase